MVPVVASLPVILRLRQRSLVRGLVLSLGAFTVSLHVAGFPNIESLHGSHWQIAILVFAGWGMAETGRCLHRRWSLYHAGILLLLWANLMILALIVFLVAFP